MKPICQLCGKRIPCGCGVTIGRRQPRFRFCAICGEREDSPYRSQWCEPDPVGTDYPYMHRWGNPQEVKS
jgi:hypothetical protein